MISLVVPTFNEIDSIEPLLRRCAATLDKIGQPYELIVVDDSSPDGTAARAQELSRELPIRVLVRPNRNGLASAVVAGWNIAKGDVLAVIDADLQHPPEVLLNLWAAIRNSNADIAIASRATAGGACTRWSPARQLTSWVARHLASCALPFTLARVRDSMSGMFMLRAEVLRGATLDPKGYKILLEVLARGRYGRCFEVPYTFGPRDQGASKLGFQQTLEYLLHLGQLARDTGQLASWISYALVGFSGALIHLAMLLFLVSEKHWPLGPALAAAIQCALCNNFFWNRYFTFRKLTSYPSISPSDLKFGFVRYEAVCVPGAVLNSLLTCVLLRSNVSLLAAASAGVVLGGIWNLFFNVPQIWQKSIGPRALARMKSLPKARSASAS
jgi:dolichol-phosphate mannosyltransferase